MGRADLCRGGHSGAPVMNMLNSTGSRGRPILEVSKISQADILMDVVVKGSLYPGARNYA